MKILITDNDSTFMKEEILDEIALYAGKNTAYRIEEITNNQMNGSITLSFKESLEKRVQILVDSENKITKNILKKVAQESMSFSSGVDECLQKIINQEGTLLGNFFVFSGGFAEVIFEKILELQISENEKNILKKQIFANYFLYNSCDEVIGVDWKKSCMYTENAKLDMTKKLIDTNNIKPNKQIIGLGDGSNDIGMVPEERGFCVAFVGSVWRENTVKKAKNKIAHNFFEVITWLSKSG